MLEKGRFLTGEELFRQTHLTLLTPVNALLTFSLSGGLAFAVISEKSRYSDCGGAAVPTELSGRRCSSPRSPTENMIFLRQEWESLSSHSPFEVKTNQF